MKNKSVPQLVVHIVGIVFAIVVLTLVLLAASNYPVQWRHEVNRERLRYLEVFSQALEYYYLDHDRVLPVLPQEPAVISNTSTCRFSCLALGREVPCFDAAAILVPGYMKEILADPLFSTEHYSGFYLYQDRSTSIVIGACNTFFGESLEIRRSLN